MSHSSSQISSGEVAYRHTHHLSSAIGPRPSATPANQAAGMYIHKAFTDLGYQVETQPFAAKSWAEITVRLKAGDREFPASANTFSPSCQVSAPFIPICSIAELQTAELKGKIAVLYGDLTKAPISPKAWFLISDWEKELINRLETGQPAALITIQSRPGEIERIFEDWEFKIPSIVVTAQVGREILRLPPAARLDLTVETQLESGETANFVARRSGLRQERLVVMAHYDTKPDTPGALDNAAGVGVLLALAELLATRELTYELELVAFANEELLPIGDDEYLRRGEGYFPEIVAAINFDGIGQLTATNSYTAVACSPDFEACLATIAEPYSGIVRVEPWPQSNHSTFSWRGVPSLAFSSSGRVPNDHLRSDTIDWISPAKLAEVTDLAAEIIIALQDQAPGWTRPATKG